MPISAKCNQCGKTYKVSEKHVGKTVPCKKCGNKFLIAEEVSFDLPDEPIVVAEMAEPQPLIDEASLGMQSLESMPVEPVDMSTLQPAQQPMMPSLVEPELQPIQPMSGQVMAGQVMQAQVVQQPVPMQQPMPMQPMPQQPMQPMPGQPMPGAIQQPMGAPQGVMDPMGAHQKPGPQPKGESADNTKMFITIAACGGVLLLFVILVFVAMRSGDSSVAESDNGNENNTTNSSTDANSSAVSTTSNTTQPGPSEPDPIKPWSLTLDPVPASNTDWTDNLIEVRDARQVKEYEFSGADAAFLAVRYESQSDRKASMLSIFDLTSGDEVMKDKLPEKTTLLAMSHDGQRVLIKQNRFPSSSKCLLSVWNFNGETLEREASWSPNDSEQFTDIKAGFFVGKDKVLVHDIRSHRISLYGLPAANEIYSVEWKSNRTIHMSPMKRHFVAHENRRLKFYSSETGQLVSQIAADDYSIMTGAAFRPDGEVLATILMQDQLYNLVQFDMKSGKQISSFPVAWGNARVQWLDAERYLQVGNHLVDLNHKSVVWKFDGAAYNRGTPSDGRLWFLHGHWMTRKVSGRGTIPVIAPIRVPDEVTAAKIEQQMVDLPSMIKVEDAVDFSYTFSASPPNASMRGEFKKRIEEKLAESGMKIDTTSPLKFKVTVREQNKGPNIEYETSRGIRRLDKETFSVPNRAIEVSMTVTDSEGKKRWQGGMTFGLSYTFMMKLEPGENPAQKLLAKRWERFDGWMKGDFSCVKPLRSITNLDQIGETKMRDLVPPDPTYATVTNPGVGTSRPVGPATKPVEPVETIPWNVSPDPRTVAASPFTKKLLKIGRGPVGGAIFTNPTAAQVAVHFHDQSSTPEKYLIRRFDLRRSRVLSQIEVPQGVTLMDYRPDGRLLMAKVPNAAGDQLKMWSCTDTGQTEALTWMAPGNDKKEFAMAMFVSTNRLLLLDKTSNELQLWSLPDMNKVYGIPWTNRPISLLSWNRRYIVTWERRFPKPDQFFDIYDTMTGKLIGRTQACPERIRSLDGGCFSDDGKTLIATYTSNESSFKTIVTYWDMATGKLQRQFKTTQVRGVNVQCGPRFLLAGKSLIDTQYHSVVWDYVTLKPIAGGPDHRCYFIEQNLGSSFLVATDMPSQQVQDAIQAVVDKKRPVAGGGGEVPWSGKYGIGISQLSSKAERVTVRSEFRNLIGNGLQ